MVRQEKGKAAKALFRLSPRIGPSWLNGQRTRGLPLLAALVFVLMVPVFVSMLVDMRPGLMLVVVPVMAVGTGFVAMLVLMLFLVIATHLKVTSLALILLIKISISPVAVKGSSAPTGGENQSCPGLNLG